MPEAKQGALIPVVRHGPAGQAPGVRADLATALCRDGEISLVRAAHVAEMVVASFIAHLGGLGIAAIWLTAAETNADLDTLEQFDERAGRAVRQPSASGWRARRR